MRNLQIILGTTLFTSLVACTQPQPKDTSSSSEFGGFDEQDTSSVYSSPSAEKEVIHPSKEKHVELTKEDLIKAGFIPVNGDVFSIDSALIASISTKSTKLTSQTARLLIDDYGKISNYLLIDSLKTNESYETYVDGLSIGQIKNADAYALHVMELQDATILAFWGIEEETVEACPYYSGIKIFATAIYEQQPQDVIIVGEISQSSDAPMHSLVTKYSTITTEGDIKNRRKEAYTEGDEPETITRTDKMWSVSAGDISLEDENSY